jgi:hypothetical protein
LGSSFGAIIGNKRTFNIKENKTSGANTHNQIAESVSCRDGFVEACPTFRTDFLLLI